MSCLKSSLFLLEISSVYRPAQIAVFLPPFFWSRNNRNIEAVRYSIKLLLEGSELVYLCDCPEDKRGIQCVHKRIGRSPRKSLVDVNLSLMQLHPDSRTPDRVAALGSLLLPSYIVLIYVLSIELITEVLYAFG